MLDSAPTGTVSADLSDRSLSDDLRQLAEDARALAQAEMAYQKSRAAFAGQETRRIVALVVLAGALAFFALMILTVGLLLALTPILTAWGATAVVVGGLVLLAGICAAGAAGRWSRMKGLLSDEPE